ncbi:LPO_1073/Vpar_1526 family protein [Niallia sp. JL1B1071]|uniref:LPO_1073/Vpar_1526 family protein n=1 Tax=Niallia tiangongensis TaxID=3237105 RepID=UPI0037DC9A9D
MWEWITDNKVFSGIGGTVLTLVADYLGYLFKKKGKEEPTQSIQTGDNSNNIQGKKVIVNQTNHYEGFNYSTVKEVALDIYRSNFMQLSEEAADIAYRRVESLVTAYLDRLVKDSPEALKNTIDPDVQYAIFNAQKVHARLGDKDIANMLVELLVNRTKNNDYSTLRIVLNEAIEVIPKLTKKHINTLTFLFIINEVTLENNDLKGFLFLLKEYLPDLSKETYFFKHLQYSGCFSTLPGKKDFYNQIFMKFPQLLYGKDVKKEVLAVDSDIEKVESYWRGTYASSLEMTSVCMTIAHANLAKFPSMKSELSIWIDD